MISAVNQRWGTKEQELSDETVVVVKLGADEDTVTYLRVKLLESEQKFEANGMCEWGDRNSNSNLRLEGRLSLEKLTYEWLFNERV